MLEAQQLLAERFQSIQDSRAGSVFFIEHGMATGDLKELQAKVQGALRVRDLDSSWWDAHCLPLLVVAAEVGYHYRGSGTDFWPLLEEELGSTLGATERRRIRDMFAVNARRYRGARPPVTRWAEAFHQIAWPITHALVPIEFHRPLAQTLANLRTNVAEVDDDTLYRAILVGASLPSARFATLLEDAQLIVAVARCLLADEAGALSREIVARVAADLEADHVARRGVAVARTHQRAARQRAPSGVPDMPQTELVRGTLQLRKTDSGLALEALFPALDGAIALRVRHALRRRRFTTSLWGVSARVPSDQLLSGLPFSLRLTSIPDPDVPLFPELAAAELDPQDAAILQRFELLMEPTHVFAVSADGDLGRLVRGTALSGHRRYWVLTDSTSSTLRAARPLGEVGPYRCLELDPKDEACAAALAALGYAVRFGVSVSFAGAPTIDRDATTATFERGDARVIIPQRVTPSGAISVEFAGAVTCPAAGEVVRVIVGDGDHTVRIASDTAAREFAFRGVPFVPPRPAPLQIELRSVERTVQALLSGRMGFVVDGLAPLNGLQLTVSLDAGGKTFCATDRVGPLPEVVSEGHPLLECLLDEQTRQVLAVASSATLRVQAHNLAAVAWQLERPVRPCWWTSGHDGEPVLVCETGELPSGVVRGAAPHLEPLDQAPDTGEVWLLAPISKTLEELGASAMFTTLCLAPEQASLGAPVLKKPKTLRRRSGSEAAVGLEDLVRSYLRWALAETQTFVAELKRRQVTAQLDAWIVELCCGEVWALNESSLPSCDPWSLLRDDCDEKGLGRDDVIKLARHHERSVTRLAVSEIRRAIPELWARVGPPSDLGPDDYEALDLACGRAYQRFAEECRQRGDLDTAEELEEADPGNAPDEWDPVLELVSERAELRPLAELLLPTDTASWLMSLDAASMSIDDVGDELASWARSASTRKALAGASPTADVLKAIYAVWVEPDVALTMDWRGALDTIIAERPIARAVRYVALRSRAARRGGGA